MYIDNSTQELEQIFIKLSIKNRTKLLERAYILLEKQIEEKLYNKKKWT